MGMFNLEAFGSLLVSQSSTYCLIRFGRNLDVLINFRCKED